MQASFLYWETKHWRRNPVMFENCTPPAFTVRTDFFNVVLSEIPQSLVSLCILIDRSIQARICTYLLLAARPRASVVVAEFFMIT